MDVSVLKYRTSNIRHGLVTNRLNEQLLFDLLLVAQLVRVLHQYRRGQGFESRTSLNFFRLSFRNCKSCV